jgi:hypothetical protein
MTSESPGRLMTMARNGFDRRLVRLPAGCERPYDDSEWADELVVVVCGAIELEGLSGRRWTFSKGAILWLTDLPLRSLHNSGDETAILMAVSRPINSRPPTRPI